MLVYKIMPIIKSAAKALRQTKKRTLVNQKKVAVLKTELKKLKKQKTPQQLTKIYSLVDKMVKTHLIHKNKAARIKHTASKLVLAQSPKKTAVKTKTK